MTIALVTNHACVDGRNRIEYAIAVRRDGVTVFKVGSFRHLSIGVDTKALYRVAILIAYRVGYGMRTVIGLTRYILPVVTAVDHRRVIPIAEESEERYAKVFVNNAVNFKRFKRYETFNINAVREYVPKTRDSVRIHGELSVNSYTLTCGNDNCVVFKVCLKCAPCAYVKLSAVNHDSSSAVGRLFGKSDEAELILKRLVAKVCYVEVKVEYACPICIAADLKLRSYIRRSGQISMCPYSRAKIHHACALFTDESSYALIVLDGCRCRHKKRINEVKLLLRIEAGEVSVNILFYESHAARNVRSRHRCSVPCLVGVVRTEAYSGIDVAAGSDNLGLNLKISGCAAAREARRLAREIKIKEFAGYDRKRAVTCLEVSHVLLKDRYCGNEVVVNLHVDGAGLIVYDDNADSACIGSVCNLFGEGNVTAAYNCYLARYVYVLIILGEAESADYILMLAGDRCELLRRVRRSVDITKARTVNLDMTHNCRCVIRCRYRKRLRPR